MKIGASSGSFELIPAGAHQAVCVGVHDLGVQREEYMGKPRESHKMVIIFELKTKMKEGENAGKPFVYSAWYTASIGEKANLARDVTSWRGHGFSKEELDGAFDPELPESQGGLYGKEALLTFVHKPKANGDMKATLASVIARPEQVPSMIPTLNTSGPYKPDWVTEKQSEAIDQTAGAVPQGDFYDDTGFNPNPVEPPTENF